MSETFNALCNRLGSDKGDCMPNGNHYAHWYEKWFSDIREDVRSVLEIGTHNGGSARALCEYFPNSRVMTADIFDKTQLDSSRIRTRTLDQSSAAQLDDFVRKCSALGERFDIILDDGSHDVSHQQLTFGKLFKTLNSRGVYIIEDLGSSFFLEGVTLYGYQQNKQKVENNTVHFLLNRPFSSPWIDVSDAEYINQHIDSVSIFDRENTNCTYSRNFKCQNGVPLRSITSLIQKR
jgi:spermidine synthase